VDRAQAVARSASTASSGIVLAGGRSRRFGGDKLTALVDGVPLVDHAIAALQRVCSEVIVVVEPGRRLSAVDPGTHHSSAVRVVQEVEAFGGPLAAALVGLQAAIYPRVLLVGGDMPRLVPAVLELLVGRLAASDASVAVLRSDGRLQALPVALRRDPALVAAKEVLDRGERSLQAMLSHVPPVVIEEDEWRRLDPTGTTLEDIDRPADLRRGRR
jgi:molybdenum cofactor guanylyltransferase